MPITVRVKRLDKELPIPEYQTDGSSGMDLYSGEDTIIHPGSFNDIATGIALEIPKGFEGQVRARSGLAMSSGIGVLNSPGTIDSDYRGEIKVILFNLGKDKFTVKRGDRIAQLIIGPVERVEMEEVEVLSKTERGRGGFGSTD